MTNKVIELNKMGEGFTKCYEVWSCLFLALRTHRNGEGDGAREEDADHPPGHALRLTHPDLPCCLELAATGGVAAAAVVTASSVIVVVSIGALALPPRFLLPLYLLLASPLCSLCARLLFMPCAVL